MQGVTILMANILVVRFNDVLGEELADALRTRRHAVGICVGDQPVPEAIQAYGDGVDLIIVDVSLADEACLRVLKGVARYRSEHGPRPMVLCVSTVYRGPQFELEIERKGARLVYA